MAIGAFSSLLHTCIEQVLLSIDREGSRLRGATQPLLFDHPLLPCPTSNRRMCKSGKGQKASVEYLFECHVDFEPGWHHSWRLVAVTRGPSTLRTALTNNHQGSHCNLNGHESRVEWPPLALPWRGEG